MINNIYICIYICIYIYICVCVCVCVYICVCVYVCVYVCIFVYLYIYIYMYIDSANLSWRNSFPAFDLSFKCCESCNVFYFLRYGIPDFRSDIWCRLLPFCFSINIINLKFCSCLMSKIIIIFHEMRIFTNLLYRQAIIHFEHFDG